MTTPGFTAETTLYKHITTTDLLAGGSQPMGTQPWFLKTVAWLKGLYVLVG
jgi:hypothetical protein